MREIRKLLVANRGEIALRIMRSVKEMGIKTAAVFSDADRSSPFVRYADEAVHIGASPSSQSYLSAEKIIAAAKKVKADAIHPGYGFLSENDSFAEKVAQAGIVFIGPSAKSIRMMGNKLAAKEVAAKLNVPLVPGTSRAVTDTAQAMKEAERIGYPVLLKAAAGGGGKGMRVVYDKSELPPQMERAQSEALSAFGDNSVFIEKYIPSPRHIEIQILADSHGNVVHLFERECSIQRRHQKLIEEAPSPVMTAALRKKMGDCATAIAKACGYTNAGTVEFLTDEKLNFYFLEVNTRLQVEHPVTEMVTGIDLVKEQIRVAQGEKLGFIQEDLQIRGHAIELRVNAEDPFNDFLPNAGILKTYRKPSGAGVRVDDVYEEGMEIPIFYDPMIAKLITCGRHRDEAIVRMARAIDEFRISGMRTTLPFGRFIMHHPEFRKGNLSTRFIEEHFSPEKLAHSDNSEAEIASIIGALLMEQQQTVVNRKAETGISRWKQNRLNLEL
ncbi:MAG TPA: acetyl-CoA carboxylase biotin carboxylase subunit [Chitinophagales bacterium]|nr:acetyl-CoA carboxylase biotin carboxylase subunit [Chitinophagales bacterium]